VIVVAAIPIYAPHTEEVAQREQHIATLGSLRDRESRIYLPTESVSGAVYSTTLSNKTDGKTSFAIYKPDHPVHRDRSFLLIACAGRIVTHTSIVELTCEYRQILNRFPSIWPNVYRAVAGTGGSFDSTLGPL